MKVLKLQIYLEGDDLIDEHSCFRDMYFDVLKITGWYIPDSDECIPEGAINLLHDGDITTIKQDEHIIKYLTEEFINKAIV